MQPFVIILILIVAPMVLGALLKMFKAYQEEVDRQNQRKKPRGAIPTVPVSSSPSSSAATGRGSGEIDRFLQEIDKLRQKADSPIRVAPVKAVPVAKAVPRVEPPPFVTTAPIAPTRGVIIGEMPVARVAAPAQTQPRQPQAGGPSAAKVTSRGNSVPITPFGKNLAALLTSKQSIPLAVVLQEVLGPPKCKQ